MQMTSSTTKKHTAIEAVLARLIWSGSMLSAILLAAGIVVMLTGSSVTATRFISAGIVTLMATPIIRVLAAGLIFTRERDWLFAVFCLVVLCTLAVGVFLGTSFN
jgi:uncharacterized membrane protein